MHLIWRKLQANKRTHFLISLLMIIASAFIQVFVLQVFMAPCNLISGGFTGIALFINRVGSLLGLDLSTSMLIILLNVPVAAFCYRAISKRFVLLSAVQFFLVSFLLEVLNFEPFFYDVFMNILFGGLIWGFSITLALSAGGSTGGTDFIAQYVSNKVHKSIFDYVFVFNCCMYLAYGFSFGWIYAGYSIIFQFISTQVINTNYKRYRKVTMEITCQDPEVVCKAFFDATRHGMSIIECRGGYSGEKYYICKSTVSANEVNDILSEIMAADSHGLVNLYHSLNFYGNFYQKPIE